MGTADLLNAGRVLFMARLMRRRKTASSLNRGLHAQALSVKHHSTVHIQVKNIRGEIG